MASGSFLVDRWWHRIRTGNCPLFLHINYVFLKIKVEHETLLSWERIVLFVVMYLAVYPVISWVAFLNVSNPDQVIIYFSIQIIHDFHQLALRLYYA